MEFLNNLQTVLLKDMDLMSLTIALTFLSFVVMFWWAQLQHKINWIDLIKKPGSETISLTKLIQLIGAIVATWIMVKLAMGDKITWDILAIYLAYVGSVEGYSKFVSAKYGMPGGKRKDDPAA